MPNKEANIYLQSKQLTINQIIINENLKDSLFKVISCNIEKVQLLNPSLNILTQKFQVEVSNIDLILLPRFSSVDKENLEKSPESSESSESSEEEDQKQQNSNFIQKQKFKSGNNGCKEPQKTEEFSILNNFVNKILSNLEVKIQNVCVRVLTQDITENSKEIPTILFKISQIEYKKQLSPQFQVQRQPQPKQQQQQQSLQTSQSKLLNPQQQPKINLQPFQQPQTSQQPVSDLQIILDKKELLIQDITIHYLNDFKIHPDQIHKKGQLQKLKFPFEYPLINDPSTILVIKPIILNQKNSNQTNNSQIQNPLHQSIYLSFNFNSENVQLKENDNNQNTNYINTLGISVNIPNIELMIDVNQIKGISQFLSKIQNYSILKKVQNELLLLLPKEESCDIQNIQKKEADINNEGFQQFQKEVEEDQMIDLYGTIIKTNSTFKDVDKIKAQLPKSKKAQSDSLKQLYNKKNKAKAANQKKKKNTIFGKYYWINKFMEKGLKEQMKEELGNENQNLSDQQINELLHESQQQFQQEIQNDIMGQGFQNDLFSSLMFSSDQKQFQNHDQSLDLKKLQLQIVFNLQKLSLFVICNEKEQSYDRIFDCINLLISQPDQNKYKSDNNDQFPLKRSDHKIGHTYYNGEIRKFEVCIQIKHKDTLKHNQDISKNPFAQPSNIDQQKSTNFLSSQHVIIQLRTQALVFNRYDLCYFPQQSVQLSKQISNILVILNQYYILGKVIKGQNEINQQVQGHNLSSNNILEESIVSNQYESFSQSSGIFQSAVEFYQLEQIEESQFIKRQQLQQLNAQPLADQSLSQVIQPLNDIVYNQQNFHNYIIGQLFFINSQSNHFCKSELLEILPLSKIEQENSVLRSKIIIQKYKKNIKIKGRMNIGNIRITMNWNDMLSILLLNKLISTSLKSDQQIYQAFTIQQEIQRLQQEPINKPEKKKEINNQKKKRLNIESFEILSDGINIKINNTITFHDILITGQIIESQAIEQVLFRECTCAQSSRKENQYPQNIYTQIQIDNAKLFIINTDKLKINIPIFEIFTVFQSQNLKGQSLQIPLLSLTELDLNISNGDCIQQSSQQLKDKYKVQRAKIIFEDKEISEDSSSSSSSEQEIIVDGQGPEKLVISQQIKNEIQIIDQVSQPKQMQQQIQSGLEIQISIKQVLIEIDVKNIKYIIQYLVNLEKQAKLILVLLDILKCQGLEFVKSQEQSFIINANCLENKINNNNNEGAYLEKKKSPSLQIKIKVFDVQIQIIDISKYIKTLQEKNIKQDTKQINQQLFQINEPIQLIKLRLKNVDLFIELSSELIRNKQVSILDKEYKESEQLIKINFKINDLFIIDYTQPIPQFHPDYLMETIIIQQSNQKYIAQVSSSFEEELTTSQPFVLLYIQQGLYEKYEEPKAIQIYMDINIAMERDFNRLITMDKILQLFLLKENETLNDQKIKKGKLQQIYSDLDTLKRNPMKCDINLVLQGLIGRLTFEYAKLVLSVQTLIQEDIIPLIDNLFMKIESFQSQLNKQEIMEIQSNPDQIQLNLNFQDISIDYVPVTSNKLYKSLFLLQNNQEYEKKDLNENLKYQLFKTPLRCLIYLNDSKLTLKETIKNNNQGLKSSNLNIKEVTFVAKQFSINILDNSSTKTKITSSYKMVTNSNLLNYLNQTLLLDDQYSLDSISGCGLLDQLGFVQIFAIDHIELQHKVIKEIKQSNEQVKQHQELIDKNNSNDLFETTYGSVNIQKQEKLEQKQNILQNIKHQEIKSSNLDIQVLNNQNNQIIEEKLSININKLIIFLAKDSLLCIQSISQIINARLDKGQKKISKKINLNNQQREEFKEKQFENFQKIQEEIQSKFELQRIIEDFLFEELEKQSNIQPPNTDNTNYNAQQCKLKLNQSDTEFEFDIGNEKSREGSDILIIDDSIQDQYLSDINEGGIHISKLKQGFDLQKVLIDNYIPELKENDINESRHRDCHQIKEEIIKQDDQSKKQQVINLNDLFIKFIINIEINTIDLKLYEGLDFDFDQEALILQVQQSAFASKQEQIQKQNTNSQISQISKSRPSEKQLIIQQDSSKIKPQQALPLFVIDEDYMNKDNQQKKKVYNTQSIEQEIRQLDINKNQIPENTSSMSFSNNSESQSNQSNNNKEDKSQSLIDYMDSSQIKNCNNYKQQQLGLSVQQSLKRKRKSTRSGNNYFQILIKNPIFSQIKQIPMSQNNQISEQIQSQLDQFELRTRICFSVKELQFKETVSRSRSQSPKYLLQLPDQYKYDNQICIIILTDEFNKKNNLNTQSTNNNFKSSIIKEEEFKVQIQTFKLLLNQDLILFFMKFFDIDLNQSKQMQSPSQNQSMMESQLTHSDQSTSKISDKLQKQYIRQLKIQPFQAILSYQSKSLNLSNLSQGNKIELLNIFNINELKIKVKQYEITQRLKRDIVLKHMLEFYKQDLVQNQKISFIKAIGPIRSIANITGAIYGVVNKPYQNYVQEKSVILGFKQGFYGLYSVFTNEASGLSSKVISTFIGEKKNKKEQK